MWSCDLWREALQHFPCDTSTLKGQYHIVCAMVTCCDQLVGYILGSLFKLFNFIRFSSVETAHVLRRISECQQQFEFSLMAIFGNLIHKNPQ